MTNTPNSRPLGETQKSLLRSLREHGSWTRNCGWLWDTPSGTVRLLETLVARGAAFREREDGRDVYRAVSNEGINVHTETTPPPYGERKRRQLVDLPSRRYHVECFDRNKKRVSGFEVRAESMGEALAKAANGIAVKINPSQHKVTVTLLQ